PRYAYRDIERERATGTGSSLAPVVRAGGGKGATPTAFREARAAAAKGRGAIAGMRRSRGEPERPPTMSNWNAVEMLTGRLPSVKR
ncbi:MAG TPA: hypothetical protein VFU81_08170, partial [Thermomicrobiales bacterium]|nr:hypothetical protein [Thermomicrobiales bacterium]